MTTTATATATSAPASVNLSDHCQKLTVRYADDFKPESVTQSEQTGDLYIDSAAAESHEESTSQSSPPTTATATAASAAAAPQQQQLADLVLTSTQSQSTSYFTGNYQHRSQENDYVLIYDPQSDEFVLEKVHGFVHVRKVDKDKVQSLQAKQQLPTAAASRTVGSSMPSTATEIISSNSSSISRKRDAAAAGLTAAPSAQPTATAAAQFAAKRPKISSSQAVPAQSASIQPMSLHGGPMSLIGNTVDDDDSDEESSSDEEDDADSLDGL